MYERHYISHTASSEVIPSSVWRDQTKDKQTNKSGEKRVPKKISAYHVERSIFIIYDTALYVLNV